MPRSLSVSLRMATVVASLHVASAVAAEPPAQPGAALPKDGAWARYHVVIKSTPESAESDTLKVTFAFVGRESHDGKECCWIEVRISPSDKSETMSVKCLVAEQDLRESERPFEHVLKSGRRSPDGNVFDGDDQANRGLGNFVIFLPGPLKAARNLDEPQMVKYQQGNLEIAAGLAGSYMNSSADDTVTADYSIWMHPDVPAGFAHARFTLRHKADGEEAGYSYHVEFFLEETGTDAKPSF